jgi:hypothetical protein
MTLSRIVRNGLCAGLFACAALGAVVARAQALAPRDQASVILVGHSLINFDMPSFLQSIADSRGLRMQKAVQVLIGSPLSNNLANCRRASSLLEIDASKFTFSCDAIDAGTGTGPWDTLVLTDANSTIASNRQWNRTEEVISTYASQFIGRNPAGRILLFTTWESLTRYGADWAANQPADLRQYEEMAAGATSLARARGVATTVEVIPVNIAVRDLVAAVQSGGVPGVTSRGQVFLDDVHMTSLGDYFVASVVFSAIFNRSPEGATGAPPGVSVATAVALQRLAWQVVSTYRGSATAAPTTPRAPTLIRVD